MTIFNAIILGLIQGVAEFLPISGSGHLSIVENLFGLSAAGQKHALFGFLLDIAMLVSLCVVYRRELGELFNDCVTMFTTNDAKLRDKSRLGSRQVLMLIISALPMLLVVPIHGLVEQLHARTVFVGLMLILTGCLLYVSDQFLPGKKDGKNITVLDALIIGVCQCVGVLPGLSRMAATITAGLCCGLDKEYAVKYTFLLSIPTVLGASILSLVNLFRYGVKVQFIPAYLIGTAIALLAGVVSIGTLQLIGKKSSVGSFRAYCWGAGVITIFLTAIL